MKTLTSKQENLCDALRETPNDLPVTPIHPTRLGDRRGPLFGLALKPKVSSNAMSSAEEVGDLYSAALTKLTANVRPLIMNLTELANEYKRPHARVIARLIEDRIRTVSRGCCYAVPNPIILFFVPFPLSGIYEMLH